VGGRRGAAPRRPTNDSSPPPPRTPRLPAGTLDAPSVSSFADQGPVFVNNSVFEEWESVLPPDSPFPFMSEIWVVNQTNWSAATLVSTANIFAVPVAGEIAVTGTNYTHVKVGEPSKATFSVSGLTKCPMAPLCEAGSDLRLASRSATGLQRTPRPTHPLPLAATEQ
jgi:hypothetical protein